MARGTSLTDELKAQVLAGLLAGSGVREVSRATGVPLSTVSRLKNETMPQVLAGSPESSPEPSPAKNIGSKSVPKNAPLAAEPQAERATEVSQGELVQVGTPVGTQKNTAPNPLYALVSTLVSENLQTLIAHAQMARQPHWFEKQNADSIGVFDGIMADKTTRILEAAAAAQPLEAL